MVDLPRLREAFDGDEIHPLDVADDRDPGHRDGESTAQSARSSSSGESATISSSADAREAEQSLDLSPSLDHGEPPAGLAGSLVGLDERVQTGGVHEPKLSQIDDQQIDVGVADAVELLLERRAGGKVELALDGEHDGTALVAHLDAKVLLRTHR